MEELYRMIEDKIYAAGYEGQVSGEEIYDEICDEIEDKEEGSYIFMSKKEDDTIYEYKIDVMKELSERGFTSTRMRKEKILSEATMQNLRKGKGITTDTLNTICVILRCQPSDVLEIIPTDEEKIKYF